MEKRIAVLSGDGIGPEITPEAIKVLTAVSEIQGHKFNYQHSSVGGVAFDEATKDIRYLSKQC